MTLKDTMHGGSIEMLWGISIVFLIISIILLSGKGGFLIAGYNTSSKEKKEEYDVKKLCRIIGAGMAIITILLFVVTIWIDTLPANFSYVILVVILLDTITTIILCNSPICQKKDDFATIERELEDKNEYKKSYKLFVIWLIVFCVIPFATIFLPKIPIQIILAIIDNFMTISCFFLTYLVYKTESIYWYNNITFEQAKEAGSERRKKYAFNVMKLFGYFTLIFIVYNIISILVGIPYGIDIVFVSIGLIVTAVKTIFIKL